MSKMVDKDELDFLKYMKEKGGFESQLKDPVQAFAGAEVTDKPINIKTPEMNEKKAEDMMRKAGQAMNVANDASSPRLSALKKLAGKGARAAGIVAAPLVGLGTALSSGDATAAVPLLGSVEGAGMSSQDENQFIAERKAEVDYSKSQAAQDRKKALAKLAKL